MTVISFLASHQGSLARAVIEGCASGRVPGGVGVVISNNGTSVVLERARAAGLRTAHLSSATHPDPEQLDRAIRTALEAVGTDLVVLAGYMKKVGPETLAAYSGRVVNVHPALLPKHGGQGMYGSLVHRAVALAGDTVSGATVHLVTADYDRGPILEQRTVDLVPGDGADVIEAKVRAVERDLLVDVVARFASTGSFEPTTAPDEVPSVSGGVARGPGDPQGPEDERHLER